MIRRYAAKAITVWPGGCLDDELGGGWVEVEPRTGELAKTPSQSEARQKYG